LCKYHEKWRLNMGHVMFAQEGEKIKESIPYYELIIEKDKDTALLDVPSVALANLCVAFIMENQSKTASFMYYQSRYRNIVLCKGKF